MAGTVEVVNRIGTCHTCVKVLEIYGTNEYVSPWNCTCAPGALNAQNQQLKFSAGKYVGRHFRFAWQGAPKGAKVKYRPGASNLDHIFSNQIPTGGGGRVPRSLSGRTKRTIS